MTVAEGITTIDCDFYSKAGKSLERLGFAKGLSNYPSFISQTSLKEEMNKMWEEGDNIAKFCRQYTDCGEVLEGYIRENFRFLENYSLENMRATPWTAVNFLKKSYIEGIKKSYETKKLELRPILLEDSVAMVS